jgi:Telomere resolvase
MYTLDEVNEYRLQLAQLTDAEIQAIPCSRNGKPGTASDWLRKCGVMHFSRDGERMGIHQMRADEARAELQKVAVTARALASLPSDMPYMPTEITDAPKTKDTAALVAIAKQELTKLRIVDGVTVPYVEGSEAVVALQLAQRILNALPDYFVPGDDATSSVRRSRHHTRLNLRSEVVGELEKWEQELKAGDTPENYRIAATIAPFKRYLFQATAADSATKKEEGRAKVENRNTNRADVRIQPLRDWATATLAKLTPTTPKNKWREVVLALCFVTGRRAYSEIMSTAEFEYVDDTHVRFTGQAKGRDSKDDDFSLTIPVFAPADQVVRALTWLGSGEGRDSKRVSIADTNGDAEAARKKAHSKYSKELTEYFKANVKHLIEFVEPADEAHSPTIHSLRALYAKNYARIYHPDSQFVTLNLRDILGHSAADEGTTKRYEVDFNLVD